MKKSLIALAALAAVGSVQAQSAVTIYGIMDAGYSKQVDTTDAGVKTTTTGHASQDVRSNTPRIGLRGVEDLGGGMRATFQWEQSIVMGAAAGFSSSSTAGNRISEVGIAGKFGTVQLGRNASGINAIVNGFDPFGAASTIGIVGQEGYANRANRIVYTTPQLVPGLTLSAGVIDQTAKGGSPAQENGGKGVSFGGSYAAGKFQAGFNYTKSETAAYTASATGGFNATGLVSVSQVGNATTASVLTGTSAASTSASQARSEAKDMALGASYDFGFARTFGRISKREDTNLVTGAMTNEHNSWMLGATVPVGKVMLLGSYSKGTDQAGATAAKLDREGYQIGAKYMFSKRTNAYLINGRETTETTTNTRESKQEITMIGLQHNF